MSTLRSLLLLAAVAVAVSASACTSETGEPDEEEAVASEDALTQGGCSQAQIRSRQSVCREQVCPSQGKRSRGLRYCKIYSDYYTFNKPQVDAPCACR